VIAIDRRGRGESGDTAPYSLSREFEDVAAIAESIAQPVSLLGHSFGAICALESALLTANLHKLVLYEPPLPVEGARIYPTGVIQRLTSLLDAGDRAGVLTTFMKEVVRMPQSELELLRSSPTWPARVAAAHTLPRELAAHEAYRFHPNRFNTMRTPALLLLGGDSPDFFAAAIRTLEMALPNARVATLPRQQHIAMDTAPDLFVREVVAFLH
jgi:pimeloyl-ACP methyl ester carboxylesterase